MRTRLIIVLCSVLVLLFTRAAPCSPDVCLLTWDGANAEYVRGLLHEGRLRNLRRLTREGTLFRYAQTSFPSKTAAGHAALFTGAYGDVNGIAANEVEKGRDRTHTVLDLKSGFDGTNFLVETLWSASSRQGKSTVVLFAPDTEPPEHFLKGPGAGRLHIFKGFGGKVLDYQVVTERSARPLRAVLSSLPPHEGRPRAFSFLLGDTRFAGAVIDARIDGRVRYDSIVLRAGKAGRWLVMRDPLHPRCLGPVQASFRGRLAAVYFQFLAVSPDGRGFRFVHSAAYEERVSGRSVSPRYIAETGGFLGNGPVALYQRGQLGLPFHKGGDGLAERRYLAFTATINRVLGRKLAWSVRTFDPKVVVGYTPFPDEALHMWLGFASPACNGGDRRLAAKARALLVEVFEQCDRYLGAVMPVCGPRTRLALCSDHGMAPFHGSFHPNTVLRAAGLLATGARGRVDLSATKVLYGFENGAFLKVNSVAYKDGIVRPEEEKGVLDEAVRALSEVREPGTGRALVCGFYYPAVDGAALGIGGPRGGQVYLDILPGYYFDPRVARESVEELRAPGGGHVFLSTREDMHALCVMRGPGIPRGRVHGAIRIIDVVPTLCRGAGFSPPSGATGRAVRFGGRGRRGPKAVSR